MLNTTTASIALTATASSAWSTLYRISERAWEGVEFASDVVSFGWSVATSPDAIRFYDRTAYKICVGALWIGAIAYVLGRRAFDYGRAFRVWCDTLVEESLQPVEVVEESQSATTDESIPDGVEECLETASVSFYESLSSFQLRGECSLRGIVWRNAHGKGRHLSKREMIEALSQN